MPGLGVAAMVVDTGGGGSAMVINAGAVKNKNKRKVSLAGLALMS